MKTHNTSVRLKQLITERNLRQVDILNAAKPYCDKYGVKLGKNDISQYVSGKVEPGQEKLSILGMALNVSEAWLMGYDVPMTREIKIPATISGDGLDEEVNRLFGILSPEKREAVAEYIRYVAGTKGK